ncbi:TetR/AcrR family transcriptional regulator [Hirschia baltica]|uniref:Transcriptional regulator, TetR family n=1 Tax=Hirschia baltica (strain ATCC 49814 / DSM 5838 / IFAM 1418) TaxID=582402 RepID=C6XP76_HIRBI|nr:TetR/AcrR family transcriptional regulator [Hirschia baltica]ACT60256.1 transcriptional regulator, TetR family [Hirschia baltica ATCC 49814]
MDTHQTESPEARPLVKTDRRWVKNHTTLLAIGIELISQKGVENITIDLIIQKAGVSKQTFSNHFLDLEALIKEVWHDSIQLIENKVTAANAHTTDPAERIARGIAVYAQLAISTPDRIGFLVRYWFNSPASDLRNQGLETDLSSGLISGRFKFSDVESALLFILGGAGAMIRRILEAKSENEAVGITQEVLTLMMKAIGLNTQDSLLVATKATEEIVRSKTIP